MDGIDERWLADWSTQLRSAAQQAMDEVVSTYLPEYDDPDIGPPVPAPELTELTARLPWLPSPLTDLYRYVGPISLPDINNGLFIHPPHALAPEATPDRIAHPDEPAEQVVVFASDGGGTLYALSLDTPTVYRLSEASYIDGVYAGGSIELIADDLQEFLTDLLTAVASFAEDGSITDL